MPTAILFASLSIFLILSIPIGFAIGLAIISAVLYSGDLPAAFLIQKMYNSLDSFPLLAVPLFVLAGELMQRGQIARKLLNVSKNLIGHLPGGLALISILTCLFYGALSGSSPATVAAVGGIMIPSMTEEGYDTPFATAVNTAGGCLGVMIPPSVPLIIYGITTNTSIADLFIAGIGAGILFSFALMAISFIISKKRGYYGLDHRASLKDVGRALWDAKWALAVPVIVLGGIYGGIVTPTEAAVIAVVWTLIVEVFIHRGINFAGIYDSLHSTVITTASIFVIVATAVAMGQILTIENIPGKLVAFLSGVSPNPIIILLAINVILLILGTFMDMLASIMIMAPLLLPLVKYYDVDPIHFGIIMVVNLSIGFLTPPVGLNLYIGAQIGKTSIEKLTKALFPFYVACIIALLFITYIPGISMFLPKLLK